MSAFDREERRRGDYVEAAQSPLAMWAHPHSTLLGPNAGAKRPHQSRSD
ncbi:hypothetical protein QUB46_29290 [Microcoleus sp. A6-D1]